MSTLWLISQVNAKRLIQTWFKANGGKKKSYTVPALCEEKEELQLLGHIIYQARNGKRLTVQMYNDRHEKVKKYYIDHISRN